MASLDVKISLDDILKSLASKDDGILNEIKAIAIDEFKKYVRSGLKVLNEPSWQGKRKLIIDDDTYFEITLSEFDEYARKLRDKHELSRN